MKRMLIEATVLVGLLFTIGYLGTRIVDLRQNNRFIQEQRESLLTYIDTIENRNASLVVDKNEFKRLVSTNDSLRNIIKGYKPKTITRVETVNIVTEVRDSVVFRDTVILRQIDTTLNTRFYSLALSLKPSQINIGLRVPTGLNVVTSVRKVPQTGFGWWFKKRLKVRDNTVTATNPYVDVTDVNVIEVR